MEVVRVLVWVLSGNTLYGDSRFAGGWFIYGTVFLRWT